MVKQVRIKFVLFLSITVLLLSTIYLFTRVGSLNETIESSNSMLEKQKKEIDKLSEEKANLLIKNSKEETKKEESFDQLASDFSKAYIEYDSAKLKEKRDTLLKLANKELVDSLLSEDTIEQIEDQNKKYDSNEKWEKNNFYLSDRDFKNIYLSSKNYENSSEGKLTYITIIDYETKQKEGKTAGKQYIELSIDIEQKKVSEMKLLNVLSE